MRIVGIAILTWVGILVLMSIIGWKAKDEKYTLASQLFFSILITTAVVLLII